MRIEENYSLEKHNTFHLPVKARISEVAVICCL